ncbi:hypothetical protein [Piscibacillus halophilus]|uniref:Uncharacterized protein n=1 Tax=Piscibacillus halophilus TaxID=571933 RepID=A0A1H9HFC7_9BACI|nr:hypothetical protein [Piscibacillus halophilus]SEQ60972.1 hypothetical protein SAMN05216362_1194 [Piscibacillus halophilus]
MGKHEFHEKNDVEQLKAKLSESYQMLKMLKEENNQQINSDIKTDLKSLIKKINHIEGAVQKLNEDQQERVENVDNQSPSIQQELKELKSIFLTMQQDLSDIKQLLSEQNEVNQTPPTTQPMNQQQPVPQNRSMNTQVHRPSRASGYSQLQQIFNSSRSVQQYKKKR